MRIFILALVILSIIPAQNIQQLIHTAIKKHPSLKTIEHRLMAMDENILLSQKISNPDLSITVADIQLSNPLSRDLEAMQYQAINLKQKFPWFGKLDARKSYTQAQKKVILDSYKSAKVQLAKEIRMTAYTLKELEERIKIVKKYMDVTKQNITLYNAYASTESQNHSNSMNASLLLTKVKIKSQNYQSLLKTQQAKLKYLVQKRVTKVSDTLRLRKPKSLSYYLKRLKNNPQYKMRLSQTHVANANEALQTLDTMPDPYVKVGYFNRSDYNDYASITVGASLPLYGSEKIKTQVARLNVLSSQSASLDYRSSLESEIETMYAKLMETYRIYTILNTQTLPQLEHMFELSQASIQEGGDLFAYTNLLEQKLNLEEESISIKAEYFRTTAQLKSLIGEL